MKYDKDYNNDLNDYLDFIELKSEKLKLNNYPTYYDFDTIIAQVLKTTNNKDIGIFPAQKEQKENKGIRIQDYFPENYTELKDLITNIGLNSDTFKLIATGTFTFVFDTGNNQVLKIFNKTASKKEGNGTRPKSKYVLQPVCVYDDFAGMYEIALFPKLNTSGVTKDHKKILTAKLLEEGFFFSDNKLANIGLSSNGLPYVIDSDAIYDNYKEGEKIEIESHIEKLRPDSQWVLFDCTVQGSKKVIDTSQSTRWKFDEDYKGRDSWQQKTKDTDQRLLINS